MWLSMVCMCSVVDYTVGVLFIRYIYPNQLLFAVAGQAYFPISVASRQYKWIYLMAINSKHN